MDEVVCRDSGWFTILPFRWFYFYRVNVGRQVHEYLRVNC